MPNMKLVAMEMIPCKQGVAVSRKTIVDKNKMLKDTPPPGRGAAPCPRQRPEEGAKALPTHLY